MGPNYFKFTPGFNWWYVVLPIEILFMALAGWNCYYGHTSVHSKKGARKNLKVKAILCTVILDVLVVCESSSGFVQILDNQLVGQESPLYIYVLGFMGLGLAFCVYYLLLVGIGNKFAKMKRHYIIKNSHKWRKDRGRW